MAKRQISFNDPVVKLILTIAAAAAVFYVLCQQFILKPHKRKLVRLQQNIDCVKLESKIGKLYQEVIAYEKLISPQKDTFWLQTQITVSAGKARLNIKSIEPLPAKHIPPYSYVSFKIKTTCTYAQLVEFIGLIEGNPYLIGIESMRLNGIEDYQPEVYKNSLQKKSLANIELVIGTLY